MFHTENCASAHPEAALWGPHMRSTTNDVVGVLRSTTVMHYLRCKLKRIGLASFV
ncbi:hypothetical protein Sjap_020225 [Stephania japonica]|uniref:Uncharacterized protein n=1 Tax=Stephania japonica TaxID=461633 RepID=A0AAP0F1N8_9MAGN